MLAGVRRRAGGPRAPQLFLQRPCPVAQGDQFAPLLLQPGLEPGLFLRGDGQPLLELPVLRAHDVGVGHALRLPAGVLILQPLQLLAGGLELVAQVGQLLGVDRGILLQPGLVRQVALQFGQAQAGRLVFRAQRLQLAAEGVEIHVRGVEVDAIRGVAFEFRQPPPQRFVLRPLGVEFGVRALPLFLQVAGEGVQVGLPRLQLAQHVGRGRRFAQPDLLFGLAARRLQGGRGVEHLLPPVVDLVLLVLQQRQQVFALALAAVHCHGPLLQVRLALGHGLLLDPRHGPLLVQPPPQVPVQPHQPLPRRLQPPRLRPRQRRFRDRRRFRDGRRGRHRPGVGRRRQVDLEAEGADLQRVVVGQADVLDGLAVELGADARVGVAQQPAVARLDEQAVDRRHLRRVEHEVARRRPADDQEFAVERPHLARAAAVGQDQGGFRGIDLVVVFAHENTPQVSVAVAAGGGVAAPRGWRLQGR